jgi:hypothetical protein
MPASANKQNVAPSVHQASPHGVTFTEDRPERRRQRILVPHLDAERFGHLDRTVGRAGIHDKYLIDQRTSDDLRVATWASIVPTVERTVRVGRMRVT